LLEQPQQHGAGTGGHLRVASAAGSGYVVGMERWREAAREVCE
jgi:hypothetical protein